MLLEMEKPGEAMKRVYSVGVAAVIGLLVQTAPLYAAEKTTTTKLGSFTTGFFYKSSVPADGVVQLSKCTPVTDRNLARFGNYICSASGAGFRCTGKGLDVIFVFGDRSACQADRSQLLNAEDE